MYFHLYCLFSPRSVFKTRAGKVEKALTPLGVLVTVNKEKPRKGSFVIIRERDGKSETVVELLDLTRPFKKLRDLDIDALVEKLVEEENKASSKSSSHEAPVAAESE